MRAPILASHLTQDLIRQIGTEYIDTYFPSYRQQQTRFNRFSTFFKQHFTCPMFNLALRLENLDLLGENGDYTPKDGWLFLIGILYFESNPTFSSYSPIEKTMCEWLQSVFGIKVPFFRTEASGNQARSIVESMFVESYSEYTNNEESMTIAP